MNSHFKKSICFLVVLGLCCCSRTFSTCTEQGFLSRGTSSRVHGLQWLQHEGAVGAAPGLWSTGSAVTGHRLFAPRHLNLSRLGIEPASPALAGGLFTTVPPGKSADSLVSSKRIINLMSPNLLCLWKVSCNISCSLITKYIQLNF